MYTIIKQIDFYRNRLEPAWEFPDRDDQWLWARTIREYVYTKYDVLYVYDDGTYEEETGLDDVPDSVWDISRNELIYDDIKSGLKKR